MGLRDQWKDRLGELRAKLGSGGLARGFFAVLGLLLLCLAFHRTRLALTLAGWTTTSGSIIASRIQSRLVVDGRHRGTVYDALVTYEYRVGDRTLRGRRIRFEGTSDIHVTKVAPLVKRYPAGRTVVVLYDPEDPEEAILEKPSSWLTAAAVLAGLALLALAASKGASMAVARGLLHIFG